MGEGAAGQDLLPPLDGVYHPNITVYGTQSARLTWDAHGYIRLATASGTADSPLYTQLFHVTPSEVKKVTSMMDSIRITLTTNKSYQLSAVPEASLAVATTGVAGLVYSHHKYAKTPTDAWLQAFDESGVRVVRISYGKMVGIAVIIAVALIAVLAGVAFLLM